MITNNLREVGGSHYEILDIEPVALFSQYRLSWFQGEAIKYVSRFFRKNGLIDLKKAAHICQMATSLDKYPNTYNGVISLDDNLLSRYLYQFIHSFAEPNSYNIFKDVVMFVLNKEYDKAYSKISDLIYSEYADILKTYNVD